MIPETILQFDVPSRAEDLARREHNRFAKESLGQTLVWHWRKHQRLHFQASNRSRYNHAPRSRKYEKRKRRRRGRVIDFVFSGRSREVLTRQYRGPRVGGSAEGGKRKLAGSLLLRFPFKGGSGRSRGSNADVLKRMVLEMGRWADDEARAGSGEFLRRYMGRVKAHRGSRQRVKVKI